MKPIVLKTKQELDIYINPQRQNILRRLRIADAPMTPKQLSDQIGISPSSVQHHIGKLLSVGVVALSHTEKIRGITAKYYQTTPNPVQIGSYTQDSNDEQRLAILQNALNDTFTGFTEYYRASRNAAGHTGQNGDILYGILHLTQDEAKQVYGLIRDFIRNHERKTDNTGAWEYALITYPVSESAK